MPYNPLPILIMLAGGYFLVKLRAFYIIHPIRSYRGVLKSLGNKERLKSFSLALAGTLGVGNVFGVAVGIIVGGEGSVFWLLVSSLFSSVLKYAEILLAKDTREYGGGIFYSIRAAFGKMGRVISSFYAVLTLLLALVMGASLQTYTVVDTICEKIDTPPVIIAIFFAALIFFSVVGGADKVAKITLFTIPLTTIIYIILALCVIISNASRLPEVVLTIFRDATSLPALGGGIIGSAVLTAIREGFSRGILSNEAGAGTSATAHSLAEHASPREAGLFGTLEVVFDTVILCMLTALAILTAIPDPSLYNEGMSLIFAAVSTPLGDGALGVLLICVFSFAYSTVVCWYFYGTEALRQLTGRRCYPIFLPLFLCAVILGGVLGEMALVVASDVILLLMTLATLPTLIKKSDRIAHLSDLENL